METNQLELLQILQSKGSYTSFYIDVICLSLLVILAIFIYRYFVNPDKINMTLLIVVFVVSIGITGKFSYDMALDTRFTPSDLHKQLTEVKNEYPAVYDISTANFVESAFTKCYKTGYLELKGHNGKPLSCPQTYFYKEYLPTVMVTDSAKTMEVTKEAEVDNPVPIWVWVVGILMVCLLIRRPKTTMENEL